MKNFLIILLLANISACAANTVNNRAIECRNYGFQDGTKEFDACLKSGKATVKKAPKKVETDIISDDTPANTAPRN